MKQESKVFPNPTRWIIILSTILLFMPLWLSAQNIKDTTSIYFPSNGGYWILKSQYKTVGKFLNWALSDTLPVIRLTGWADKNGSEAYNKKLSIRRARSVRKYLVAKGISPDRIQIEGCGVDVNAIKDEKARRVEMTGLMPEQRKVTNVNIPSTMNEQPVVIVQTETEAQSDVNCSNSDRLSETAAQSQTKQIASTYQKQTIPSRYYLGIGGGVSFGHSTLCSFAMDGTHTGWNISILSGYQFSKLLSAEISLDYTHLTLGTYDCCQHLWLASDGERHFTPSTGKDNYQYNDLRSTSNLYSLGGHLNINLLSIWKDDSRWSTLISPAIYGVCSNADIKQLSTGNKININTSTKFHLGLGVDLGVGYMINSHFGLRLSTGINYLTGKSIDSMPKAEHQANYIWNTGLKLIFKL